MERYLFTKQKKSAFYNLLTFLKAKGVKSCIKTESKEHQKEQEAI